MIKKSVIPSKLKTADEILEDVRWWEKKRKKFNLIVFGFGFVSLIFIIPPYFFFGIAPLLFCLIGASIYFLLINLFYSLSWGIEIFNHIYFEGRIKLQINRKLLFHIFAWGMGIITLLLGVLLGAWGSYNFDLG